MAKIVQMKTKDPVRQTIDGIIETLNKNEDLQEELAEFIIVAKRRVPDEEVEQVGSRYQIIYSWRGEDSSVSVLGLLQYMIAEVQRYIYEEG